MTHKYENMQRVCIIRADDLFPAQIVECQYYDAAPCYKVRNLITNQTEMCFEHELIEMVSQNV